MLNVFLQVFLQDLVRNLFGEGNDVFCEGDWARSVELYTEALGVSEYAESEDIDMPCETRERLYANRAAAYLHVVSPCFCHSGGCSVGGRAAVKDLTASKKTISNLDSNATDTRI